LQSRGDAFGDQALNCADDRPDYMSESPHLFRAHLEKTRDHLPAAGFREDRCVGRPLFLVRTQSGKLADGRPFQCRIVGSARSPPRGARCVFAARTVRWRSIFAVHTWIVVKERGAATYSRYDYTAWGEPIRSNGLAVTKVAPRKMPSPRSAANAVFPKKAKGNQDVSGERRQFELDQRHEQLDRLDEEGELRAAHDDDDD
jgi:hypothetical protein